MSTQHMVVQQAVTKGSFLMRALHRPPPQASTAAPNTTGGAVRAAESSRRPHLSSPRQRPVSGLRGSSRPASCGAHCSMYAAARPRQLPAARAEGQPAASSASVGGGATGARGPVPIRPRGLP